MNWVCPIAPAQEPVMPRGLTSPDWMIFSAATSCSSKKRPRRPSKASVARDCRIGLLPRYSP